MLRWAILSALACALTAYYGFSGPFTIAKGISQVLSYFLMVSTLACGAIALFQGRDK